MSRAMMQLTETIGAASMADKLADRVRTEQRHIEGVLSEVSAVWPLNILSRMEELLVKRDYASIETLLAEWDTWLEKSEDVQVRMRRTAVVIGAFVEFYAGAE